MNNQRYGQSNTQENLKSINQHNQQYQLNAILTDKEHKRPHKQNDELYASVRLERPPDILPTPYPKKRTTASGRQTTESSTARRSNNRNNPEPFNLNIGQPQTYQQQPSQMIQPIQQQFPQSEQQQPMNQQNQSQMLQPDIMMDTDLPIEKRKSSQPKKPRTKKPAPDIKYDIVSDVLKHKADIEIGDLITVAPSLRKKLVDKCKPRRKPVKQQSEQSQQPQQLQQQPERTVAFIEDDEISTTAAYTTVAIGDMNVKTLVDCGAAKTCMSKALADALGLEIDASSESVFTLGNGSKQPALGMIYDVPIEVKENMIIPCTIEVLPSCPAHLILGNNWLNRAKAKIDFQTATLKVVYKNKKANLSIHFIRRSKELPKMTTFHQNYQEPISLTNSYSSKKVHFEEESDSQSDTEEEEEESESEEASEEEYEEEEEEHPLLVLEDDTKEEVIITNTKETYTIQAAKTGVMIQAKSSKMISFSKPEKESTNWIYYFDITNPKLNYALGYFDPCSSLIVNKRTIEIRFYNRTNKDIYISPKEELGVLEKFNLCKDTVLSAYKLEPSSEMCTMEYDKVQLIKAEEHEQNMLETELYNKLEVTNLPSDIQLRFRKLLNKYKHIFDWDNNTMGHTTLIQHRIIIDKDTLPISHRPYRMSPMEAEYLQKELDKYCRLGIITPSNSPWAAPVILVKKKNGEYRMVIDYRKLNAVTKKDSYPLPRIDDLLDTLGKAKVFSALDMRSGFHQVPLAEDSKELTAFTTKYGTYHYNMLPMGLVNSPATFQRLIDLCFRSLINKCLVAYIDDLNVYSNNYYEHLQHLKQVFDCIDTANLKLNPEKCFFFKDHLKFLGYIVTKEGIQTDPAKIQKIIDYPIPKTVTQVRSFLGIASYYRRFIKNFAAIARPLHEQTKTKKKVPWTMKTTESFNQLKKLLTTAPVLARPDFSKEFILVTDASKLGLGCVLTQLDDDGKEHPIIFASRGLRSGEPNYAPTKLECLAIVWAVKMFRPYLLGKKFTIITDHSALTGLLKTSNPTGIIARWIIILTEYEFEIKYRPGRINESADFLSRLGY